MKWNLRSKQLSLGIKYVRILILNFLASRAWERNIFIKMVFCYSRLWWLILSTFLVSMHIMHMIFLAFSKFLPNFWFLFIWVIYFHNKNYPFLPSFLYSGMFCFQCLVVVPSGTQGTKWYQDWTWNSCMLSSYLVTWTLSSHRKKTHTHIYIFILPCPHICTYIIYIFLSHSNSL